MSKHRLVARDDARHNTMRWISATGALALCVGLAFIAAPSAGAVSTTVTTAAQLKTALADGTNDTVVLGANVTIGDGTHPDVSQTLAKTLDLHGQTLTINNVNANLAGIRVAGAASLTVEDTTGLGSLDATGGDNGAGIGGNQTEDAASISVISGSVTAHGGSNAAGIGGGGNNGSTPGGAGGTQDYSGGSITATGGASGAGIGGGSAGIGGTTSVSGGHVTATGGDGGSGIGGGDGGGGGNETFSGGLTTATGGHEGAGVGGGDLGPGGNVTVSGDPDPTTAPTVLVAQGGFGGSGIGGGGISNGGSLSVTGGAVQATGGANAAGVGGGDSSGSGGTVSVTGGALVAAGGSSGAGIGGGSNGSGGALITASPGAVSAADGGGGASAVGAGGAGGAFGTLSNGGGLTIPSGATLRIPAGATATNTSTGSILDKGTITAGATAGTLQNDGVIFLSSGGTIQGGGDGGAGIVTVSHHNYKLVFDTNGGPDPNPAPVHVYASTALASGATFPTVNPPTGGIFLGWYTAASGGTQVTTSTDLSALLAPGPTTTTLFAHYRVPQTITFPIIGDQTFGAPDFNISATASSGLPVTYSAGPPSVCTISGNTIHIVAAGACTVNANQAGNANFLPAPQVQRTFQVKVGVLTVTASGSQTFGGAPSFVASVSLPAGVTLSGTMSCTYLAGNVLIKPSLAPGSYTIDPLTCGGIVVTGPNASSYHLVLGGGSFTVSKADLQVQATGTQVYQGTPTFTPISTPPPNVSVTGTLTCTQVNGPSPIDANLPVGSYIVDTSTCSGLTLTGTQAFGYQILYANGPFTVTPKPVTVTATGTAAYGGTPTFTPQATLPSGLSFAGTLSCTKLTGNVAISASLAANTYTIDAKTCSGLSLAGTGASNYRVVYANGPFTVTKATLAIDTHTNTTADANHLHKYTFTTTVTNTANNLPVAGIKVSVLVAFNGTFRATCAALTNASGVATCSSSYFLLFLSPGHAYTASTAATVNYFAATGNGKLGS